MCGIAGYTLLGREYTPEVLEFFSNLLIQSKVRGKHATGVAFVASGADKVYCYKQSISADEFVQTDRWKKICSLAPNSMIGHTRYSTSGPPGDNLNNQPIALQDTAIVHNGLVSMASKEEFEGDYGVNCSTYNDTEIILRMVENHHSSTLAESIAKAFTRIHEVSPPIFACGLLDRKGSVTVVRDHIRPLWLFYIARWKVVGFCSTRDIFERAARSVYLNPSACDTVLWECQPYTVYTLGKRIEKDAVRLGFSYPEGQRFSRPTLVEIPKTSSDTGFTGLDNPEYEQGDHREHIRESFKRYSAAAVASWEIDPNYPMMNYLFRRYEFSKSQEYWACFLYGVFYHPGTVFYVMQEFPEFEKVDLGRLARWHSENWKALRYNKDRKYEKGHFVEMFESYLSLIGSQTPTAQEEFFNRLLADDPVESFHKVTKALLKLLRFGRYSVYIYTECLARCMGMPIQADDMFLKGADSPRAGLCYVLGLEDWAKGKLTEEQWAHLEAEALKLMREINAEFPNMKPKMDHWFMESCLCAYKGFFHNGRYLGYYTHRMADEILQMETAPVTSGIDWKVLWQFRKEQLPGEYLGEYSQPPILKVKNEWRHVLEREGRMIGMWPMIKRGILPDTPLGGS